MWTKKGQLFVLLGSLALIIGLFLSNLVFVMLGFVLLAIVLLSALQRLRNETALLRRGVVEAEHEGYFGVAFTRTVSSPRMIESAQPSVTLALENPTRTTRRFEIMDTVPDTVALVGGSNSGSVTVPAGSTERFEYNLSCPIKGFYHLGPIKIRETDICQFFYDEKELELTTPFQVFPAIFDVKEFKVKSKIPKLYAGSTIINKPGQGTEFYSIRDYVPGDPFKSINWPAYARTRKLMVNEHEMEAVIELTIILDYRSVTITGMVLNNPHLASARAAASLASYFIKRRDKVGLAIYNDRVVYMHREGGMKHLDRLMDHITGEAVQGDMPLAAAVTTITQDIRKGMPVVVISTLEGDLSAYDGFKHLRALGCDVSVIAPTGIALERRASASGASEGVTDMLDCLELERETQLRQIQSLGVKVASWDIREPFQNALAAVVARAMNGGRRG